MSEFDETDVELERELRRRIGPLPEVHQAFEAFQQRAHRARRRRQGTWLVGGAVVVALGGVAAALPRGTAGHPAPVPARSGTLIQLPGVSGPETSGAVGPEVTSDRHSTDGVPATPGHPTSVGRPTGSATTPNSSPAPGESGPSGTDPSGQPPTTTSAPTTCSSPGGAVTVAWAGKPLVVAVRPNVGFTLEEVSREDSSIGAVFVASDGSTDRLVASWTGATFVCHNTQGVPTSDSTGPSGDRPISAPPTTASVPPTAPTTPPCPPSTVPHPGARDHDTARGGADIGQRTSHRTTITTPAAPHARSSTLGPAPVLLLRAGRPTAADA